LWSTKVFQATGGLTAASNGDVKSPKIIREALGMFTG